MKGGLAAAGFQQLAKAREDQAAQGSGIGQLPFQLGPFQLLPVDPPLDPRTGIAFPVVFGTEEAVDVDPGYALEGEEDGVGRQKALGFKLRALFGMGKGVEIADIQLIGAEASRGAVSVGDQPAVGLRLVQEQLQFRFFQDALHRQQPDAIMGGQEVEKAGLFRARF